jgi:hypothetical protein
MSEQSQGQTATRVTVKTDAPIGQVFIVEYFDGREWKPEPIASTTGAK